MKSIAASERGVARHQTIQNNFSPNNRRFDELAQVCRVRRAIPIRRLAWRVLTGKYQGGPGPRARGFGLSFGLSRASGNGPALRQRTRPLVSTERFMAIAAEADEPGDAGGGMVEAARFCRPDHRRVSAEDQLGDIFAAADLVLLLRMSRKPTRSCEIRHPMDSWRTAGAFGSLHFMV